ncbi:Exocyst complex component 3-like protein 4 [Varanus komodoensis]|nr:Exocyst complex component 3-like protein 4 [Varanus komodoensis]
MCPSKNSPPKNDQSENGKQNRKSFIRKLTFRRSMGKLERSSMEESAISRFSRNFSLRNIKRKEDDDRTSKEIDGIPSNAVDCEGEDYVYKEPMSVAAVPFLDLETISVLVVMQIHQLIQKGHLLEAFRNISALEKELLAARGAKKFDDNPKEYIVRAKDVNMLYDSVSKEIQHIAEEILDLPKGDTQVLTSLVALIEEEEKTHAGAANIAVPSEPASCLGLARNWRELWEKTVAESVKARVLKVPVPFKADNSPWLAMHLEHLERRITQDLLTVKHWLQKSFPQHYNVCDTYLNAFHEALSFHLQGILEGNSSLGYNEYYTLLDWIINRYSSEVFLGHPDLKPEMKTEELPSLLTPGLLAKLKNDCINSVKQKTRNCFENILMLEMKEKWESEEQPDAPQSQYHSSLSLDIQTLIGEHMKTSGNISKKLETAVLEVNLKELIEFIP